MRSVLDSPRLLRFERPGLNAKYLGKHRVESKGAVEVAGANGEKTCGADKMWGRAHQGGLKIRNLLLHHRRDGLGDVIHVVQIDRGYADAAGGDAVHAEFGAQALHLGGGEA